MTFHGFLAFFGIIGKYRKCSGLEDALYQVTVYPGSLNAVLTGKHYNRCCWVHEALFRSIGEIIY